jgi:hypothetical protein
LLSDEKPLAVEVPLVKGVMESEGDIVVNLVIQYSGVDAMVRKSFRERGL